MVTSHLTLFGWASFAASKVTTSRRVVDKMATRRRIGVSIATTEAARRALMQPVPCWEKVWLTPENVAPGSTLRVYKWVKTDKQQVSSL
jgi:hypothetical protein